MTTQTFPARFQYLNDIREFVADVARRNGFAEKEIYSLQLAADEAASNIIEHAYGGETDATFDVGCNSDGESLVIVMRDGGKSFDWSAVKEPNIKSELSKRQIGGLGVYLIRKLMDEVHYQPTSAGNFLTMIKRKG